MTSLTDQLRGHGITPVFREGKVKLRGLAGKPNDLVAWAVNLVRENRERLISELTGQEPAPGSFLPEAVRQAVGQVQAVFPGAVLAAWEPDTSQWGWLHKAAALEHLSDVTRQSTGRWWSWPDSILAAMDDDKLAFEVFMAMVLDHVRSKLH